MFQIAATLACAEDGGTVAAFNFEKMCLPTCTIHSRDGGNQYYKNNIFGKLNYSDNIHISKIYHEPEFTYQKIPFEEDMALYGYFQSEKYFINHRKLIRDTFNIPDEEFMITQYDQLLSKNMVVSIHIRRNDYLNLKDYHPVCSLEYYQNASKIFDGATYLIFSDDIEWCKKNMSFLKNTHYVEGLTDVQNILLMSRCHHHIIANSSFSWWGAWLNNNQKKIVIAPKQWFGPCSHNKTVDLYCEGWRVI